MTTKKPRPTTLGGRLAEVREYAGLSLGQAARLMSMQAGHIFDHEGDWVVPDDATLARYAETYGVRTEVLRDGSVPATRDELLASLVCLKTATKGLLSANDEAELLRFLELVRDQPKKTKKEGA